MAERKCSHFKHIANSIIAMVNIDFIHIKEVTFQLSLLYVIYPISYDSIRLALFLDECSLSHAFFSHFIFKSV